jgi:hypothetical protein
MKDFLKVGGLENRDLGSLDWGGHRSWKEHDESVPEQGFLQEMHVFLILQMKSSCSFPISRIVKKCTFLLKQVNAGLDN